MICTLRSIRAFVIITMLGFVVGCSSRPPAAGFPVAYPCVVRDSGKPIAVIGDLQTTSLGERLLFRREFTERQQELLLDDLKKQEIGLLAIVGDMVFTASSRKEWALFDSMVAPIARKVPVLPALGNHDYHCLVGEFCFNHAVPENVLSRFGWLQPGQEYICEYGEVTLVFIDSETGLKSQGMWLDRELRKLERLNRRVVVFTHRPPYSNVDRSKPGPRPNEEVRKQITDRLAGSPIGRLSIHGHVHGFEHLQIGNMHYVISGGGGGPRPWLAAERTTDIYSGADCEVDSDGRVKRPFNYLLLWAYDRQIRIVMRGLCSGDSEVRELYSRVVRYP